MEGMSYGETAWYFAAAFNKNLSHRRSSVPFASGEIKLIWVLLVFAPRRSFDIRFGVISRRRSNFCACLQFLLNCVERINSRSRNTLLVSRWSYFSDTKVFGQVENGMENSVTRLANYSWIVSFRELKRRRKVAFLNRLSLKGTSTWIKYECSRGEEWNANF